MNNKGFTLVELIVTFALATVIITILFNVVIIIKNNYEETSTRTNLMINQATLSNLLNSKINDDNLISYTECTGDFCYRFVFSNGETVELKVTETKIQFGNYIYVLAKGDKVVNPSLTYDEPYLILKIPVRAKMYPNEDFGINLIYKRV